MTKKIFISPVDCLQEGVLETPEILLCHSKSFNENRKGINKTTLLEMYKEMRYIRHFEDILKELKQSGEYGNMSFDLSGPVHLGHGVEAACVGQANALNKNDFSFGSHRSHSELIARVLVYIKSIDDDGVMQMMYNYHNGDIILALEKTDIFNKLPVKKQALLFFFYGFISEILGKRTGLQGGVTGSMNAFFTPAGVYPSNAIVGASAPIAVGAALRKKNIGESDSISVANLGDGALGCGVVHEAMNFAAMKQFDTLWENPGALPVLFCFFNNGYGMGGQTVGETMSYDYLVRSALGVNEEGLFAKRINGLDVLEVYHATKRIKEQILSYKCPALLDMVVYRYEGHSQSDTENCRDRKEIDVWKEIDPIKTYKDQLVNAKLLSEEDEIIITNEVEIILNYAFRLALDGEISPDAEFCKKFTTELTDKSDEIKKALDISSSMIDACSCDDLSDVIKIAFNKYPNLIAYGVNVRDWSLTGPFATVSKELPYARLFNAPVSEACMVSSAVGYAMTGGRVLIDFMFSGFLGRAGDEIFNQLAKWERLSGGEFALPIVIRVSTSKTYGSQHSQDWASLIAHIPGVSIFCPATQNDASVLLLKALNMNSPTVVFEPKDLLFDNNYMFNNFIGNIDERKVKPNLIKDWGPRVLKEGSEITIVSLGGALEETIKAVSILENKYSVELIDLRIVSPLKLDKIIASVAKTRRVLIVGNENENVSILSDLAYSISKHLFNELLTAPEILGAASAITPLATNIGDYFPTVGGILEKAMIVLNN